MINVWDALGVPTRYDRSRVGRVERVEPVRHAAGEAGETPSWPRPGSLPPGLPAPAPARAGRGYNPWREARERNETDARRESALRAGQLMTRDVKRLAPDASVSEAWALCRGLRHRHFPVVEALDGRLVGMLSDRDLLQVGGTPDAAPVPDVGSLQVADIMRSPVFSAHPDTPIRDIAEVMLTERIGAIAICDDEGSLVGILTRSDILRALVNRAPLDLWV